MTSTSSSRLTTWRWRWSVSEIFLIVGLLCLYAAGSLGFLLDDIETHGGSGTLAGWIASVAWPMLAVLILTYRLARWFRKA